MFYLRKVRDEECEENRVGWRSVLFSFVEFIFMLNGDVGNYNRNGKRDAQTTY